MANEWNTGLINTPSTGNSLLRALAANKPVVDSVFYLNKTIPLDGFTFKGCRFDSCVLLVNSSNFQLEQCIIDERCVIQYGTHLVKIIQLFTSRYPWWAEVAPGLAPVKNQDGTISIVG
jgi:hypothetical protein